MLEAIARAVRQAAVDQLNEEAEAVADAARAGAPGSGALRSNISTQPAVQEGGVWTATVFSADPYHRASDPNAQDPSRYNVPAFNEFGTRHMDAQPYMRPALEGRRSAIPQAIGQAVGEAASKGGRQTAGRKKVRFKLKAS